jgi:hypothetical protein
VSDGVGAEVVGIPEPIGVTNGVALVVIGATNGIGAGVRDVAAPIGVTKGAALVAVGATSGVGATIAGITVLKGGIEGVGKLGTLWGTGLDAAPGVSVSVMVMPEPPVV